MEFKGRIEFISPIEVVGEKGYQKQYLIISDEQGEYPNRLKIDSFNKTDVVATVQVGQIVTVLYNTKVTEYNGRHYCSLDLWKFKTEQPAHQTATLALATPAAASMEPEKAEPDATDGSQPLPF